MKRNVVLWILIASVSIFSWSFVPISLADADAWTEKADMPTPRCYLSTAVVNGKIYAIGGTDRGWAGRRLLSIVEEYDPSADTWNEKSDMPTARVAFSTSAANGKIYAIGGYNGGHISIVEEYDPATDKWTRKADMPTPRSDLSTSAVNGKIYAIGGYNRGNWLSTVEEYDPATDTWTKKADMPTPRAALAVGVVNGKLYAMGGGNGTVNTTTILSIVEEYDPAKDRWAAKADMPTSRWNFSTSVVNGKVYAIGGIRLGFPFSTVEEYNPAKDRWTRRTQMPTARAYLSTSAVKGKIYAIGGATDPDTSLSGVEEYDTGFVEKGIEPKGKLTATWGQLKE